ncbi:galactose-1-phosphate uridylyltransferase-like isoform X2, partial [Dinothrombium tinctorium]
ARRPWKGRIETDAKAEQNDPNNSLCLGSHQVLMPEQEQHELFRMQAAHGCCLVICFHPNSSKNLAFREQSEIINHKSQMLVDYSRKEIIAEERIVVENQSWLVVVPFWAYWPFETILIPKRQIQRLEDMNEAEKQELASSLSTLLVKYDNIFETSFPYSMGWLGIKLVLCLVNHTNWNNSRSSE